MIASGLQSLLQRFFTDRLLKQLGASTHTVAAYRDTFRLLLRFASQRLKRQPSAIRIDDLDVALRGKFLNHLEANRGNQRKRVVDLSITHILSCLKPKDDVGETSQTAPHDNITGRRIAGASEIAAETCNLDDVSGELVV
jgi:hypothetical protein